MYSERVTKSHRQYNINLLYYKVWAYSFPEVILPSKLIRIIFMIFLRKIFLKKLSFFLIISVIGISFQNFNIYMRIHALVHQKQIANVHFLICSLNTVILVRDWEVEICQTYHWYIHCNPFYQLFKWYGYSCLT